MSLQKKLTRYNLQNKIKKHAKIKTYKLKIKKLKMHAKIKTYKLK